VPKAKKMNLLFIVPSLEPGKSGVGDYARRLGLELEAHGVCPHFVALNDPFVSEYSSVLSGEGTGRIVRIPKGTAGRSLKALRRDLGKMEPDWVSLQLVAYGFHDRAILGQLLQFFDKLSLPENREVMQHEIWIGAASNAQWKDKVQGHLQEYSLQRFHRGFQSKVVHCHAAPYRHALKGIGVESKPLPLFPNFDSRPDATESQPTTKVRFGIFSGIPPEQDLKILIAELGEGLDRVNLTGELVFFGRSGLSAGDLRSLDTDAGSVLEVQGRGEVPEETVPVMMASCHFAIAVVPLALWEKSSVVASWRGIGIPLFFPRNEVEFDGAKTPLPSGIIPMEGKWETKLLNPPEVEPPPTAEETVSF